MINVTSENLQKEFEIRKLKNTNKQLMNTNTMLNRQYKNLNEHFERRVNEEVEQRLKMIEPEKQIIEVKAKPNTRGLYKDYEKLQNKYTKIKLENKHLLLRVLVAEDAERRYKKKEEKLNNQIREINIKNKDLEEENKKIKKRNRKIKNSYEFRWNNIRLAN